MRLNLFSFVFIALFSLALGEQERLSPVKTESPRDTMRTFLSAMQAYKDGAETKDETKLNEIERAIRTLNLTDTPYVIRHEKGKEAAILLKEVLDRVIVIDYEKIPDTDNPPRRWRLKGTDIAISRVEKGERSGEYLFSQDTTYRVRDFYDRVKDLPYLEGTGGGALYRPPLLERYVPGWARKPLLGLLRWQWLGILASILLGLIFKAIVQYLVHLSEKLADVTAHEWDDKILAASKNPIGLVAATGFWFISLYALKISGTPQAVLSVSLQILFSLSLVWLAYRLTSVVSDYLTLVVKKTDFQLDDQLIPLMTRALRIFVIIFGVLITVQNLGVNVMSILAGLGLGGLAFALAAKDTAANLFGTLMILSDSPFRVGDWIKCGDVEGTVEAIGFRSTRVRTFYNSLVSIPNSVLAADHIDNMGRRQYRRITTTLGVTYNTPPEKVESFIDGIKSILTEYPHTRKDYFHVVFSGYGDSSLNIMLYFFLQVPDWTQELKDREQIYLQILRLASKLQVEFAFPSQSLYVESLPKEAKP